MIRQIRYDFDDLEMACAEIIDSDGKRGLTNLKKELNRFFKDSNCLLNPIHYFLVCVYILKLLKNL